MQTFTPKQYLQIDIANSFGLDKLTWAERLEWFEQNEAHLPNLLQDAESPALFYAGIKAWEAVKNGQPIGYPISLDATSSGIQILSVLTGDYSAAALSNVVDTGKRGDAYTSIYQLMLDKLGGTTNLQRSVVKNAVMTAYYGSEAEPIKAFGEGTPTLRVFFETLEEVTPAAWELNKALLELWNPEALNYTWVMPDNFHVKVTVEDEVTEEVKFLDEVFTVSRMENRAIPHGRCLSANLVHSVDGMVVRELGRRCNYDPERIAYVKQLLDEGPGGYQEPSETAEMVQILWDLYQQSGFLSARILDFLDSTNIHLVDETKIRELIASLPARPFKVIAIHDCFRVHPNYGNDLRRQYNLQLHLIAKSNMLEFLLKQITGNTFTITKVADFTKEILDADYALS